jgi:hypothetical protein
MIGQRVPRVVDLALLTGRGRFVDDLDLPHMLPADYVWSPHAHAALLGIETAAALALPGCMPSDPGRPPAVSRHGEAFRRSSQCRLQASGRPARPGNG